MNTGIANILRGYVATLPFTDRVAGMVRTAYKMSPSDDDSKPMISKAFPVSVDVDAKACEDEGVLQALMPNSAYKSVIYFEDMGLFLVEDADKARRDSSMFRSEIRMVCWMNGNNFAKPAGMSLSANAVMNLITVFPKTSFTNGVFQRTSIRIASQEPKTSAIFGRYSYAETSTQYLTEPHDYFALNIHTTFLVHNNCANALTPITADPCK